MANYVEQAVLKVVDQSSDSIRTVNKELSKLFVTARKGAKIKIKMEGIEVIGRAAKKATTDLISLESKGKAALSSLSRAAARTGADLSKVGTKSVAKGFNTNSAISELRRLKVAADKLSTMSKISIPVNLPGLRGAVTQARALNHELDRMARRTVTPTVNYRQNNRGPASSIPTVRVETSAFDQMLRGAALFMGAQIENAIISGLVKGATDVDVGKTRLDLQAVEKVNPELAKAIPKIAADESARDNTTSIGANTGLISEILPVLGAKNTDASAVKAILEELNRSIALQVALGKDRITAEKDAIQLLKAAEQSGSITDANGNVDLKKVDNFFDRVNQTAVQLGQEFSAQLINQMLKYLRGSKFSINDRGFVTTALLTEELGTTASVGYNQGIKQLAGQGVTKKALAEQERLGIAKPGEYVPSGLDGDGNEVFTRVGGGSVDETLLRTDLLKFAKDVIIPALKKDGVDVNDPTQVISAVSKIVSDRTAVDAVAALVIRNQELTRTVDATLATDVSNEKLDNVLNNSTLVSVAAVENQLVSVMGQLLSSIEGALIPALDGIATVAGGLAAFIAGPDGEGSPVNAGIVVGGGAAAVGGLALGLNKLFGITALAGSGPALLTAAASLEGAAISLAAGGGAGKLGKIGAAVTTAGGAAAGGGLLSGAFASVVSSPAVIAAALAGIVGAAFSMVDREAFNQDNDVDISNAMSDVAPFENLPEYVPPPIPSPAAVKAAEAAIDARLERLASGANELGSTGGTSLLTGVSVNRPEYTFGDTPVGGLNSAMELKSTFDNSTAALKETFETGATSVGSAMDFGAEAFGPVAGQGFLAYAPQIGAAIGAAAAAAIGPIRTQGAPLQTPQLVDTGRSNGF